MPAGKRTHLAARNSRAFPRWSARFAVRMPDKPISAEPVEISEGGMSFRTAESFNLAQPVELEFKLDGSDTWIKVKCAVRHASAERVGVEFLNLKRPDRLKIIDLLATKA